MIKKRSLKFKILFQDNYQKFLSKMKSGLFHLNQYHEVAHHLSFIGLKTKKGELKVRLFTRTIQNYR